MRYFSWLCLVLVGWPSISRAQYVTNGDAFSAGSCFQLTTTSPTFQTGSVWYLNKVNIQDGFDLYFDIFLGCNDGGADGIAFVLQPISTSVGNPGEGLGYLGVTPSLAVEIDTWQNPNRGDPGIDHISLQRDGVVNHGVPENLVGPFSALANGGNIEDCQDHSMRVWYRADSQILRVYIDCDLRITYTGDIVNSIFGGDPEVFWGFTGATGGFVNDQRFCLDYISFVEELQDTAICLGEPVQLFAGSGDTYLWTPSTGLSDPTIADPIATPTTTTTYVVQITDVCGQLRTDTVTIGVTDTLPPIPDQTLRLCSSGSLPLDATIPFGEAYTWDDGQTGPLRSVSQPGTYQVSIQYPCGLIQRSFLVNPPLPIGSSSSDVSCFGQSDGSATVLANGNGTFSYQWVNAATGTVVRNITNTPSSQDQANNLSAGLYTVTITNGDGCQDMIDVTVSQPPLLQASVQSQQDIVCGGTASGSVTLSASGGTPPYQYRRGSGPFQANASFANLPAGSYAFTVRDANGCLTTVNTTLTENPPLIVTVQATLPVSCAGGNDGSATLSPTGGVPPYQIGLLNGPPQTSNQLSNLSAGSYQAVVEDAAGCRDTVGFVITEPAPLTLSVLDQRNVDCQGNATGALRVQGSGGIAPYQYRFDGGPFGSDTSWANLAAGTYAVDIRDANGCLTPLTVAITEPAALQAQIDSLQMVDCYGNATGVAFVGASGGSAPYAFALLGDSLAPTPAIDSLSAGSYQFVVRDDSACLDTVSATLTEPDSLSAAVTNRVDVDCLGNNTGELSVTGSGGTQPYQYALNNGPFGPSPDFDSLFANFFTLFIRDANGCLASVDTFIATPTGLSAGIDLRIDVACHGDSTGSVLMQAQGGTSPYQYTTDGSTLTSNPLFSHLPAGPDTVTLTDANGCVVPIPYLITQPGPLTASVVEQANVACHGDSTGFVRLTVEGGVRPYQFWLNDSLPYPDTLIDRLPAGPQLITVVDDSSCSVGVPVEITQPAPLTASLATQRNVACYGDSVGAVTVAASGGVMPYTFALDSLPPDSLNRFEHLPAGDYLITVQDDSACQVAVPVEITQPDSLTLDTLRTLDIACHGDSTGEIDLLPSGGVRPYQFALDSAAFQPDSFFRRLPAGPYALTLRDDSACQADLTLTLQEPSPLRLTLAEQRMVDCYAHANGLLAVSAAGGVPAYAFRLDSSAWAADSVFAPLDTGWYRIGLRDANGCQQALDSLRISQPDSLTLALAVTDVLCADQANGTVEALLAGGTPPFAVSWNSDPPQQGVLAQNLPAGVYRAEVRDANGCEVAGADTVAQPPTLRLSLVQQADAYCDFANGAARVMAEGGVGNFRFFWQGPTPRDGAVAPNLLGGDYRAVVEDGNGCRDTLPVQIGNTPPPTAAFETAPSSPVLLSQAQVQFINRSLGAASYQWNFDDRGARSLAVNPSHHYAEEGVYQVQLIAIDARFACPDTATLPVEVIFDGAVAMPNAFTPNGDGRNDVFPVRYAGVVAGTWTVYDRWGHEVRRFPSLDQPWNGRTRSGDPAPEGVYVYRVEARLNDGREVQKSGTITLVR